MERIILVFILTLVMTSSVSSAYTIYVSYPKSVYIGQNFIITFGLVSTVINSTNFQYMTPGTKIVNVSGKTAYEGFAFYWLVDRVNISNSSELIITFIGTVVGEFTGAPGIVLYSYNFSLIQRDNQFGTYEIETGWNGILYLDKLNGYYPVISTLPRFYSGNYTVLFKKVNSSVCVYSIFVNSTEYLIKYNTGIPWDSIGYIGIRPDTDTILPSSFIVDSGISSKYVIYINDKYYTSGYTNSLSSITLRIYFPTVVNITFPQYHIYKIIIIYPDNQANIQLKFPIVQIALIVTSGVIIGLSIWKESIKVKKKT